MSESFKFSKPEWQVLKDKKVFETPIFSLRQIDLMPDKNKETANFFVLDAPEWINVIALTPEREIVLVEQYRGGIHKTTLEIPGGMVDRNENPENAAKRELLEETGFSSQKWKKIGRASSNPAILTNYTHFYLAEECKKTAEAKPDGHEDILVHQMPIAEFLELVKNGTVHHAIVLAAVAHFLLNE